MLFQDRRDAGRVLARFLCTLPVLRDTFVLGLPRGGVPVAFEVARALNVPLDIFTVRKIGAPGQKELAIGAVASGGTVVLNANIVRAVGISEEALHAAIEREKQMLERQEDAYRGGRAPLGFSAGTTILIDDGIATGASLRAAARAVRPRARQLILAAPVAAESTCRELEHEADLVVCPHMVADFEAVGRFYNNFDPTTDDEIASLLQLADLMRQQR